MWLKALVYEVSANSVLFELNLTSAKVHLLVLYAIAASCIARSSNPAAAPSTKRVGSWQPGPTSLTQLLLVTCNHLQPVIAWLVRFPIQGRSTITHSAGPMLPWPLFDACGGRSALQSVWTHDYINLRQLDAQCFLIGCLKYSNGTAAMISYRIRVRVFSCIFCCCVNLSTEDSMKNVCHKSQVFDQHSYR